MLCEKPFASNADEAAQVAQAASASGLVVMEAMHYRYHPLTQRLTEVVSELGPVRHIQAWTSFAITNPGDIRYDYGLAGGALMDGGCYAIDCLRLLGGDDASVTGALADPVGVAAGGAGRSAPSAARQWRRSAARTPRRDRCAHRRNRTSRHFAGRPTRR